MRIRFTTAFMTLLIAERGVARVGKLIDAARALLCERDFANVLENGKLFDEIILFEVADAKLSVEIMLRKARLEELASLNIES